MGDLLASVRRFVDDRLQPGMVRFVCQASIGVGLLGLAAMFLTRQGSTTAVGPQLGADFAGFYNAGRILNRPGPDAERLYDFAFQDQLYHELLPGLPAAVINPFVHPPLVAFVFRPLAQLPYELALALWLVISGGLYVAGFFLAWQSLPHSPRSDRTDALLLALAFEPFLIECWIGGQFAAVAFFFLAAAYFFEARGRPFVSGLLLGVVLYKPTMLVLILPLLLVARRWRTLAGVGVTCLAIAGLSLLAVGDKVCRDYVDVILGFAGSTTGAGMKRKDWKWIDLNFFLQLLLGGKSPVQQGLLVLLSLPPLAFLVRIWWGLDRDDARHRTLAWAAALTWTMVVNLYVGMYDTILVVLAVLLTADNVVRLTSDGKREYPPAFRYLVLALFVTAWVAQPLAIAMLAVTGDRSAVQVYTLALAAFGIYQFTLVRRFAKLES